MTNARKEPFLSFSRITGYVPRNIELYEMAVRHRSVPFKDSSGKWVNNERLEFLGDAVLNSIVADILYHHYKDEKEGFLTNARSNIVKRESLNRICFQIGLDKMIVADKKIRKSNNLNLFGNALEAFVGAVYLDLGYKKCTKFIKERLLVSSDELGSMANDNENYKSELLEWCQQRYLSLDYKLVEDTVSADNRHTFTSQIYIGGKSVCTGRGRSKKESHQAASRQALNMIEKEENFMEKYIK